MNYELIKIDGDIAYLLEKSTGVVVRTRVEDRTGLPRPIEVIYDKPAPNITPRGNWAPQTSAYIPQTGGNSRPLVPSGFKQPEPKLDLPDKPAYMPPPPHLAGVMIKEGMLGAATEMRTA